jgi:hypothetical protein
MEQLRDNYFNAKTPEEQAAIAEQIRLLRGDDPSKRYMAVSGGKEWDANAQALVERPGIVFDTRSGRYVPQGATPSIDQNPAALAIRDDPNLSREQKAAKLRALGY